MINRRKFLQSASLAVPAGGLPLAGMAGTALPDLFLHQVVHDSRFPRSHALAQHWLAGGASLNAEGCIRLVDGDITRLWLDELRPQWASEPTCLAGVTGEDVLFCLEQLAAGHDMRVHWRQEQGTAVTALAGDQALVSWLIGPRSLRDYNKKYNNWSL